MTVSIFTAYCCQRLQPHIQLQQLQEEMCARRGKHPANDLTASPFHGCISEHILTVTKNTDKALTQHCTFRDATQAYTVTMKDRRVMLIHFFIQWVLCSIASSYFSSSIVHLSKILFSRANFKRLELSISYSHHLKNEGAKKRKHKSVLLRQSMLVMILKFVHKP